VCNSSAGRAGEARFRSSNFSNNEQEIGRKFAHFAKKFRELHCTQKSFNRLISILGEHVSKKSLSLLSEDLEAQRSTHDDTKIPLMKEKEK
jgi:hypothetical protein